jgi:tRNA-2-methylthio-N6-dimethylallyladenosine synthase
MRFHVITFGCQMNVHESDWISRALAARGWSAAPEDEALALVVNTCSVRDKPEQKVYSQLGRLAPYAAADPRVFVAVGGCVAQQVGQGLLDRFPFVRLVFGTDQVHRVPDALDQLVANPGLRLALLDFTAGLEERPPVFDAPAAQSYAPGQAYVSIMQGCDNFCTYCIVPYTRGRQKSRGSRAILDECRALVERGAREITLLGQNVNSYGRDKHGDGTSFAQLLRRVAALPGLSRLRFTTSHPRDLGPDVVAAFAELPALCPACICLSRLVRIECLSGWAGIRPGALPGPGPGPARGPAGPGPDYGPHRGFPGESEEDFAATLEAMRVAEFESSFSFAYSDRPGTRAERMAGKLDQAEKLDRLARLQALQEELTARALAARVGTQAEVLVEGESVRQDPATPRSWRGRDAHGRVVNFSFAGRAPVGDLTGRLAPVRIAQPRNTPCGERRWANHGRDEGLRPGPGRAVPGAGPGAQGRRG